MTIDSGPKVAVNPYQATIWWHSSSSGSSELRWDTSNKGDFANFANDVSNTSTTLGTVHSRTISNLPAGTYSFRVRTTGAAGTATSATHSFTVEAGDAATPMGSIVASGVEAVVATATKAYVAGNFETVATRSGSGLELNAMTATAATGQPHVVGLTDVSVADGAGGTFIAGDISHVGGLQRNGIAHLLPDGGVDPYFDPGVGFDFSVLAMAVSGSKLYVGGSFTTYRGVGRSKIAALDTTTAALDTTFDPGVAGFDSGVMHLIVSGSKLYASGNFTNYQGIGRVRVAALDATTAALDTTFNPGTGASGQVSELVLSGTKLYLGGFFTTYQGVSRPRIAAIDATTAALDTTFLPGTGFDQGVRALATAGTKLYVGGDFTTYQGISRPKVAALDLTSAALDTTFLPGTGFDLGVSTLATAGTKLYVGGGFWTYQGTSRPRIAAIDATTAALDATFNPGTGFTGTVSTLTPTANRLYAGGGFTGYKGVVRGRIAALDIATNTLDTTFSPGTGFNGQVSALVISGSKLYAGGAFTTYQGTTRNRIAALDLGTATLDTTFLPGAGFNSEVFSLVTSGSKLYAGGTFATYQGASRIYVAALDTTTAAIDTTFVPGAGFTGGYVWALALSGSRLYAGGWFTAYQGSSRPYIAALSTTTAAIDTGFNPGTGFSNYVGSLTTSGTKLYAGGGFTTYQGVSRPRIAALDTATAALDATFLPGTGFDGAVSALSISGTRLYAGGQFSQYQGTARSRIAALDATSGALDTAFNPGLGIEGNVRSIATSGTKLFLGGGMYSADGVSQGGFGVFTTPGPKGVPDSGALTITTAPQQSVTPHQATIWWSTSASSSSELVWDRASRSSFAEYRYDVSNTATSLGTVHSRTISNLPAGTYFYRVRSRTAGGQQVTSSEQTFTVTTPDAATPLGSTVVDGTVNAVLEQGGRTYLAGAFTRVGTRMGGGVALQPGSADVSRTGAPQFAGAVRDAVPDGAGGWYVGGSFTRAGGLTRGRVAHILPDGGIDPNFDVGAGANQLVNSVKLSGGRLYVAGNFTTFAGTPRAYVAALDPTTGALDPTFDPGVGPNNIVRTVAVMGTRVYLGGNFSTYQGAVRGGIVAVNPVTAAVDAGFNPGTGAGGASTHVWAIATTPTRIFVSGYFTTFDGVARARIAAVDPASGALDATFDPGVGFDGGVHTLDVVGTRLYTAGNFWNYAGASRNRIAVLDTTTAALDTTFNPGTGFDQSVGSIKVDGTRVYVGGSFGAYNGTARARLAALDSTTAALVAAFDPGAGFDQAVLSVASTGSEVFVGGSFATYRGVTRTHLTAVDATSGELDTTFAPAAPNGVATALATDGTRLFVGGDFTSWGGTGRARVAAVSLTTGALDGGFDPGTGANANVTSLAVRTTRLYVGGSFTTFAGASRSGIAAVTAASGVLDAGFNPGTGANGAVQAVTHDGTRLYLGGDFTTINGVARVRIAALDPATAALDATFAPAAGPDAVVNALAVQGGSLYAGGAFTTVGASARGRVAKLNAVTGALDPAFTPGPTNNVVRAVAVDTARVVIGGGFITVQGQPRARLAVLDPTSGVVDPTLTFGSGASIAVFAAVNAISLSGTRVHAGGDYAIFNDVSQGRFAMFDLCDREVFCGDEELRDYVSLTLSSSSVTMPAVTADASSTAVFDASVQSNAFNGYSLLATDASDTNSLNCSTGGCTGVAIADWSGLPGAATTWNEAGSDYGFGVTVLSSTLEPKDTTAWGTGATQNDFVANKYVGLRASTSTLLHELSRYRATTVDTTRIALRTRVGATQTAGDYSGTIAITAVANP